jgi:hypothetical protein
MNIAIGCSISPSWGSPFNVDPTLDSFQAFPTRFCLIQDLASENSWLRSNSPGCNEQPPLSCPMPFSSPGAWVSVRLYSVHTIFHYLCSGKVSSIPVSLPSDSARGGTAQINFRFAPNTLLSSCTTLTAFVGSESEYGLSCLLVNEVTSWT